MKYIRTKDGIFELLENGLSQTPIEVQNALITGDYNQADTIEELCDGFYLDDDALMLIERFYHYWAMGDNFSNDHDGYYTMYRKDFEEGASFYGFIKTNKGLIYVAKMNDKGELELI